jgi:hypothetical protein
MRNDKKVEGRCTRVFGAYDIRGIVGDDLDGATVMAIARAYGDYLCPKELGSFLIGHDDRWSSPALAIRAPIPDGAITDIVADLKKSATAEQVDNAFKTAAEGPLEGILGYTDEELVSADIIGDTHSGIIHTLSTQVVQGRMVKDQVWYDNVGYSRRLLDELRG